MIFTISVATDKAYAIKFFHKLFEQFFKTNPKPLFSNLAKTFSYNYVTKKFLKIICSWRYAKNYTGYLFWRGAVILAKLVKLSKEEIQLLER